MTTLFLLAALAFGADVPDLYQRSYELEATGGYRTALSTLDQLPGSEKGAYTYLLRRGWLLYLDGQLDASLRAYDQAVAAEPEAIEPLLGRMLPLLAARRWADAEATGQQVLARDPRSYLGRSRTAWATYNLGRNDAAAALYRGLVADYPADVEMRAGLGWALLGQGKKADAAKAFEAVLRVAPKHASAREGLGMAQ
jgi:tetratricopeptide (TPR) repeat protein